MNIEIDQYDSVCRTCLLEKDNMKSIFNIAEILMTCAPIQIEEKDGLPTNICSECINQANQAYKFRLLCEQSDNLLRKNVIKQEIVCVTSNRSDSSSEIIQETYSIPHERDVPLINKKLSITFRNSNLHKIRRKAGNKRTNTEKSVPKEEINEFDDRNFSDHDNSDNFNKNVEENELSCRYCDMKFRYKVRLKRHEQKHLHGLKCHLCEKDFSTIKQLKNHINIHSRKGAHLCQTCGKQFTLPENLTRHQRIHSGIRPYKCPICDKSFTQSNELKSHLVTHSSEKHHLCSVCGNKYSRLISLRVHMRRMHSIPPNHRPYICSVCGRSFKDRRDLSQHMSIHKGERSHVCKVCGKAFNRSSNLRVHERIHSGHKPHVCPVCQRAFIQKHVLNTHMRTHPLYSAQQTIMTAVEKTEAILGV